MILFINSEDDKLKAHSTFYHPFVCLSMAMRSVLNQLTLDNPLFEITYNVYFAVIGLPLTLCFYYFGYQLSQCKITFSCKQCRRNFSLSFVIHIYLIYISCTKLKLEENSRSFSTFSKRIHPHIFSSTLLLIRIYLNIFFLLLISMFERHLPSVYAIVLAFKASENLKFARNKRIVYTNKYQKKKT